MSPIAPPPSPLPLQGRGKETGGTEVPPLQRDGRLLVLLYHNVGRAPRGGGLPQHWVEPGLLRAHIRYLRRVGYELVCAARARAWLEGEPGPERPALITFDDGLASLYELALPVLREERAPAVVFMVAGEVGGRTTWMPNPAHRGEPMLSWEQLRELQAAGVAIGSHGLTHARLTELPRERVAEELGESKRRLESGLGTAVEMVAYPDGACDAATEQAAREAGYRAGFSTVLGVNTRHTDRFALRRVNVRRWAYVPLLRRKIGKAEVDSR